MTYIIPSFAKNKKWGTVVSMEVHANLVEILKILCVACQIKIQPTGI